MDDVKTIVGKRIRDRRKQLSLSQEQLAEKLQTQHTYISDIERGRRNLTLTTLEVIANQLEVDVYELLLPERRTSGSLQQEAIVLIQKLDTTQLNTVVAMLREITKQRNENG